MCGLDWGFTACVIRGRTCNPKSYVKQSNKHEKACSDNQPAFIQFLFDTFSFLTPEVVDLLQSSKGRP